MIAVSAGHILPEKYMLNIGGVPTNLCHFPYSINAYDERYRDKHPQDTGGRLLSGHVHDAWKMQGRNINVGSDVWDYTPVHESELVKLFEKGE
jgi:calcineurin-like phosphoesterase family protein